LVEELTQDLPIIATRQGHGECALPQLMQDPGDIHALSTRIAEKPCSAMERSQAKPRKMHPLV